MRNKRVDITGAHQSLELPIGRAVIFSDGKGICEILTETEQPNIDELLIQEGRPDTFTEKAALQLQEYFKGKRQIFDVPLSLSGTDFQLKVYKAMFDIPGETEHNLYNDVFGTVLISMAYAHELENSEEAYGYALKDLNSNGENDLILLLDDYTVFAVFSLSDGKPVLLGTYLPRIRCAIDSEWTLFARGSGGAAYTQNYIYKISQDDGELLLIEGFGIDGWDEENEESIYYKIVDGEMKRVYKEEIAGLWDIFRDDNIEETTKYSGLMFLPLFK